MKTKTIELTAAYREALQEHLDAADPPDLRELVETMQTHYEQMASHAMILETTHALTRKERKAARDN